MSGGIVCLVRRVLLHHLISLCVRLTPPLRALRIHSRNSDSKFMVAALGHERLHDHLTTGQQLRRRDQPFFRHSVVDTRSVVKPGQVVWMAVARALCSRCSFLLGRAYIRGGGGGGERTRAAVANETGKGAGFFLWPRSRERERDRREIACTYMYR